jgi:hypothetical protein
MTRLTLVRRIVAQPSIVFDALRTPRALLSGGVRTPVPGCWPGGGEGNISIE